MSKKFMITVTTFIDESELEGETAKATAEAIKETFDVDATFTDTEVKIEEMNLQ